MTAGSVLVLGSANLDLVVTSERHPEPGETLIGGDYSEHPGGKGLNQAVASARAGATTRFVAAVGADSAGDVLLGVADDAGIDTSGVVTVDRPTGRALIVVSASGENSIVVVPGANTLCPTASAIDTDVLVAQLEVPIEVVTSSFVAARDAGAITVLNPAPATPLPPELLAVVDVIVPNEHEVDLLGGVDALLASGVGAVVVTLGERGARVHTEGRVTQVGSLAVDAVDTTGAGDTFTGYLAAGLSEGLNLVTAATRGCAAGALAATRAGAVPSIPSRAEVDAVSGV